MAKKVRALSPAAARRLRAEIEAERELRQKGIEACSHFPEGDWDREIQVARRQLHEQGLLVPGVPVSFPF
jgi:hypothetical protein